MDQTEQPVIIVGAGVAGKFAARLLAEAGQPVVVLEAGPEGREKPCGGMLNPRAQEFLSMYGGVPDEIRLPEAGPGLEFPQLEYHDPVNNIRARTTPGYRNISRRAFDDWLLETARRAGAEFRFGVRVTHASQSAEFASVEWEDGQLTGSYLLDATGSAALYHRLRTGRALNRLFCLQGRVRLDPPPHAMWAVYMREYTPLFGWIIPKGGDEFLLGAAMAPETANGSDGDTADGAPEGRGWQLLEPLLDYLNTRGIAASRVPDSIRGTHLAAVEGDSLWLGENRCLLLGEAAGLASRFSGEGISYALACARAASRAVLLNQQAEHYAAYLTRHVAHWKWAVLKGAAGASHLWRPWALLLYPLVTGHKLEYFR
jgi:flavin-dependent dehydrogenase